MRAFWDAGSPAEAERRVPQGAGVARRVRRRAGAAEERAAPTQAERTGRVELADRDHGIALDNVAEVPAEYDPARRVAAAREPARRRRPRGASGRRSARAAAGQPHSRAAARSCCTRARGRESEWWTRRPGRQHLALVDRVKRDYNVDEPRIYITGISDGGTGVYFFGHARGHRVGGVHAAQRPPSVLANPDTGADGQLFAGNLANCPLHIVNGGRDPLYPAASVAPLVEMFKRGGIPLVFQVYPEAEHDMSWWPQERAALRGVSRRAPARRAPRHGLVGDRAHRPLQPLPLARHRPARQAPGRRRARRTSTRSHRCPAM